MDGGAYGGGKAGASFDPLAFVQRPIVVLRFLCWLFAIIVFGCISSQGWLLNEQKKEYCIINNNGSACNYGVGIGVIAFLASMGFLAGEYFFEQMSSVKTRKHYVMADLAFSGLWAFLYFVGFCYLASQWSKADPTPGNYGSSNINASIVFSLFSIFTWGGCAWFAFQRFKAGVDPTFSSTYDPTANAYASYPVTTDNEQYQDPPFSGGQPQPGQVNFQAPTY
uniref:Synaptogyrin n=1 Tax=Culicoides sonorensis TaxID=179676 RepID=A0A336LX94_CULSO